MDGNNLLVNNVVNLTKRTGLPKPSRSEPTVQVSEYNLVKSGTRKEVVLNELTDALKQRPSHAKVRERIQNLRKKIKPLPKPLEKQKADRIRRSIGFDKVKEELSRYNAVVTSNRASNYLTFPLISDVQVETGKDFTGYRVKSDLQKRLEEIDPKPKVELYNLEKKKKAFSLTMEEMTERRKEMAKLKVIESYKAAKARRQNKIKSKKYHRIQRRDNVRNQIKEFEKLQESNPEEALKKLDEIERGRAEERASLRHRSTGKWARSKQVKAKYDSTNRQELAQQLTISHELTQKLKLNEESESEEETMPALKKNDTNNPWVNVTKTTNEAEAFYSGYRKFWDNNNAAVEKKTTKELETHDGKKNSEIVDTTNLKPRRNPKRKNKIRLVATTPWTVGVLSDTDEEDTDRNTYIDKKKNVQKTLKEKKRVSKNIKKEKIKKPSSDFDKLSFKKVANRPVIDEPLTEMTTTTDDAEYTNSVLTSILKTKADTTEIDSKVNNIDPSDVVNMKATHLPSELPDLLINDEEEDDNQYGAIAEAFEDDDIVESFQKERKDAIEGSQPKDIDLFLPGWGAWGGPGIKSTSRGRANKRFIIKFPKVDKRRDENKGNLIINEKSDDKIKPHLVSEVPFPFKTVKDFEASIRAPIGNTFVPETAYRRMIRPAVKTKIGAVIQPMSEDILLKTKS